MQENIKDHYLRTVSGGRQFLSVYWFWNCRRTHPSGGLQFLGATLGDPRSRAADFGAADPLTHLRPGAYSLGVAILGLPSQSFVWGPKSLGPAVGGLQS